MSKSQKKRMLAGELYDPSDKELQEDRNATQGWLKRYNSSSDLSEEALHAILSERLGTVGGRAFIRPPFYCDYGYNIHLGDGVFLNFNCIILDVARVTIGKGTQIGPGVQILTADHPRDAEVRLSGLELGRPISIGANGWIGGGAIILPGVSIGDDAIVGAGSVVTRDVPPGAVVVGNPARQR